MSAKKKVAAKKTSTRPRGPERDLASWVDSLYTTREERYALQREIDKLKKAETELRDKIVKGLPEIGATGIAGDVARVDLVPKTGVNVVDWSSLFEHITETGSFELLQKRVSDAAVKEKWESGETVPGVEPESYSDLSIHKV